MGTIKRKKPSPAMVISIVALVVAVAGTAVAGVATVSVLSKKERKQTKRIAKAEIKKAAPIGRAAHSLGPCDDDDHTGEVCATVTLNLPRPGRVLVIASTNQRAAVLDDVSGAESGSDDPTYVRGQCRLTFDGFNIEPSALALHKGEGERGSLALNRVSLPLVAGEHTFALRCFEEDGAADWFNSTISAVLLGSG